MKKLILTFFVLMSANIFAQSSIIYQNKSVYELGEKIRDGNFQALFEIGAYFDSDKNFTEFLGYHTINTNESYVAKRIVQENSFFLPDEIVIDTTTNTKQFTEFLKINKDKITFSELADGFILTPFEQRNTDFEIQELTTTKVKLLETKRDELLKLEWVKKNNIDELVKQRNPIVLLKLSSVLLKSRYRFNEYIDFQEHIVNLIQLLTKSQIVVPNETGKMSYHLEKDFYDTSKVNLFIFFTNNYEQYKWDETMNAFVNPDLAIGNVTFERNLFDLLANQNDTIAMGAFVELSQLNPEKITELASEYDRARVRFNYVLPIFTYRFLKQLTYLTDYYRKENIDYLGSKELRDAIELLKSDLTFSERRKLEDKLIDNLSLNEISAFEYWSLVYEKEWNLTYSAGRVLDKFYSKNWKDIVQNAKYLETYLLKSKCYDDIGIIGFCNNYLTKFTGTSNQVEDYLKSINTIEPKIKIQLEKALAISKEPIIYREKDKKDWYGAIDKEIKNFNKSFKKALKRSKNDKELEDNVSYLLSQINYSQIGEALESIEHINIKPYKLYSFMDRDFGFSFIGNFEKPEIRKTFLENYKKFDEQNLYIHYLKTAEIDFIDSNNSFDFDKIYEILKFDINTAFVGGGGGELDNNVYAIIKLLELYFNTTLGYPNKLCCSDNTYACDSIDRAVAWRNYLEVNGYLKKLHNEPVSFRYNDE